jgi:hypothetical protein
LKTLLEQSSYFENFFLVEFSVMVFFSKKMRRILHPSLAHGIMGICLWGSLKEVVWASARGVVAFMADEKSRCDFSVVEFIGKDVRPDVVLVTNIEKTVPAAIMSTDVKPARANLRAIRWYRAVLVYLLPKAWNDVSFALINVAFSALTRFTACTVWTSLWDNEFGHVGSPRDSILSRVRRAFMCLSHPIIIALIATLKITKWRESGGPTQKIIHAGS